MRTPTERTLRELRKHGYIAEVVERFNAHSRTTNDLFGFVDVLAIGPETLETLGIQCTSRTNMSSRIKKIADSNVFPHVAACGWRIEVWGWDKQLNGRWRVKRVELANNGGVVTDG